MPGLLAAEESTGGEALKIFGPIGGLIVGAIVVALVYVWPAVLRTREHRSKEKERRKAFLEEKKLKREQARHERRLKREQAERQQQQMVHQLVIDELQQQLQDRDNRLDLLFRRCDELRARGDDCEQRYMRSQAQVNLLEAEQIKLRSTIELIDARQQVSASPMHGEALVVVDHYRVIRDVSPGLTLLLHWLRHEMIGKDFDLFMPKRYHRANKDAFLSCLRDNRLPRRGPYMVEALTREGNEVPVEILLSSWEQEGRRFFGAAIRQRFVSTLDQAPAGKGAEKEAVVIDPGPPVQVQAPAGQPVEVKGSDGGVEVTYRPDG
jgi:PAS domain S-box-containing protein